MGRRLRGAKLRAKKRSTADAEEHLQIEAKQVEVAEVTNKADDELFVLDTTAVVPSKKQQKKKEAKKRKYQPSAKEEAQIQKLVEGHSPEELQQLAQKAKAKRNHPKVKGKVQPTFDLWEDAKPVSSVANKKQKTSEGETKSAFNRVAGIVPSSHVKITTTKPLPATGKALTIDVAKSGQSYNPDQQEHKSAITEALKVETKREYAEKEHKAPVSQGLKPETKALLLGDSDSEDDDSDSDNDDQARDDDASNSDDRPIQKRPEKLTRAQRNKQKRHRLGMKELQERKRQKKLQNEAGLAKAIAKRLTKEEKAQQERKEQMETLKAESERVKGKDVYQQLAEEDPRFAPTYPVALPSELKQGSLRTIKPKGSLVTDRMVSMMDRNMAAKKQLKKKMRVEGKRRHKIKVRGKGYEATGEGAILG